MAEETLSDSVLLTMRVNGTPRDLEVVPTASLLDVLRDQLGMTAAHMGCMTGHCGACTVTIDGRTAKSCLTMAATVEGCRITTLEDLSKPGQPLHPLQKAFWYAGGFQCGYCAPGMLLVTLELLAETPNPTDAEIREALAGNLCRCTGYQSIVRAVKAAGQALAAAGQAPA